MMQFVDNDMLIRICGFCTSPFDRRNRYWSLYCSEPCERAASSGLDERVREMLRT